jgi:hypothetical protein
MEVAISISKIIKKHYDYYAIFVIAKLPISCSLPKQKTKQKAETKIIDL